MKSVTNLDAYRSALARYAAVLKNNQADPVDEDGRAILRELQATLPLRASVARGTET